MTRPKIGMIEVDRDTAIRNVYPNIVTIDNGVPYDSSGNLITIDATLIKSEETRMQSEYDSQEYSRNRKAEYDALNQLEMQYDDKANGTTTWEDAIAAIKKKYPKG